MFGVTAVIQIFPFIALVMPQSSLCPTSLVNIATLLAIYNRPDFDEAHLRFAC